MKLFFRRLSIVLLALLLIMPMTVHAAGKASPGKTPITSKNIKISVPNLSFNRKSQTVEISVTRGKKTLVEGKDYKVVGERERKKVGTYTITIKGIGKYTGTKKVKYKVERGNPEITVDKVKTYKASKLKKKNIEFNLNVKEYSKKRILYTSRNKQIVVSKKGKVTLKKGLKQGTYKIIIQTQKTKNYYAATKVVKIKVK